MFERTSTFEIKNNNNNFQTCWQASEMGNFSSTHLLGGKVSPNFLLGPFVDISYIRVKVTIQATYINLAPRKEEYTCLPASSYIQLVAKVS